MWASEDGAFCLRQKLECRVGNDVSLESTTFQLQVGKARLLLLALLANISISTTLKPDNVGNKGSTAQLVLSVHTQRGHIYKSRSDQVVAGVTQCLVSFFNELD